MAKFLLDTGMIYQYLLNNENIVNEIKSKINKKNEFVSLLVNYIELYKKLCQRFGLDRTKRYLNILNQSKIVIFRQYDNKLKDITAKLLCEYHGLSLVDALICVEAISKKERIYTTENLIPAIAKKTGTFTAKKFSY